MPIVAINEDGTVKIARKSGRDAINVKPEELMKYNPTLLEDYNKIKTQQSVMEAGGQEKYDLKLKQEGEKDKTTFSGPDASKIALAKTGLSAISSAKKILFGDDTEGKKTTASGLLKLLGATTDLSPFNLNDNTPWGRDLQLNLFDAVESLLRLRSGAAVPEEEVKRYMKEKGPKVTDPAPVKLAKLKTIEDEYNNVLKTMGASDGGSKTVGGFKIEKIE